jgi:N-hydroxyarylamine O-acetyltransferase
MNLADYLKRINYTGDIKPDLATLTAVHRAHLLAIPYENLDIHRDCPVTVDVAQIYEKIVDQHRGGWCFEMNGLLSWALREVGFEVTRLSSHVGRSKDEPLPEGAGDHLILRVDLDKPYLADVGFGNGILEPIPLAEGSYQQGFLTYKLAQDDNRWWFTNHLYGGAGFDFDLEPHEMNYFTGQSTRLQTSPESGFVKTTVTMRFTPDGGMWILRGAVLRQITSDGTHDETIDNAAYYHQVLSDKFDLHLPDTDALWDKVWARHQAWVKENSA